MKFKQSLKLQKLLSINVKSFTLIISFALLLFSCNTNETGILKKEKKQNDWAILKLKGNVKSLTETSYCGETKPETIAKGSFVEMKRYVFNTAGNIIEKYRYKSDGTLLTKTINTYDEKNNIVEKNRYNSVDSPLTKTVYTYDDKGNNIEENEYNADGSLWQRRIFKYDDKGNLIEKNRYNSFGSLLARKTTFKYDGLGNKTEETRYNEDKSLLACYTSKYDDKGNRIAQTEYCANEIRTNFDVVTYKKKFDARGNMIQEIEYNSVGNLLSTTIYRYNEKNDMIGFKKYSPEGKILTELTQTLEYDKENNFIKLIRYENTISKFMTEREIEYY